MEYRSLDHVYDPVWNAANSSRPSKHVQISGSSRFMFFENPKTKTLLSCDSKFKLAPQPELEFPVEPYRPKFKSIGVQTQYRDSEAQTDPYSPKLTLFNVDENDPPEILLLQHLTFGNGLPATNKEIVRIIRARERREEAKSLPPITDDASTNIHKKFLEDQEKKDFLIKEKELEQIMNDRLEDFQIKMIAKNNKNELKMQSRMNSIEQELEKKRYSKTQKTQEKKFLGARINCTQFNENELSELATSFSSPKKKNKKRVDSQQSPLYSDSSKNIDSVQKIVRNSGLQSRPKRPNMDIRENSSLDRKALSLAADLHLWDGIIQSKMSKT